MILAKIADTVFRARSSVKETHGEVSRLNDVYTIGSVLLGQRVLLSSVKCITFIVLQQNKAGTTF